MARLRRADVPCERPLIGVERKWLADRQKRDPHSGMESGNFSLGEGTLTRLRALSRAVLLKGRDHRINLLHCGERQVCSFLLALAE